MSDGDEALWTADRVNEWAEEFRKKRDLGATFSLCMISDEIRRLTEERDGWMLRSADIRAHADTLADQIARLTAQLAEREADAELHPRPGFWGWLRRMLR